MQEALITYHYTYAYIMRPDNIISDNFDPDALDREYARRQAASRPAEAPAPKKPQKTVKKSSKFKDNSIVRFVTDRRTRTFAGIALLCWATYLLIAAISYFTTGADDQSAVLNNTVSEMARNPENVRNAGGALGAFLSQNFISNGLGIGAFVIIFYFFALAWKLLNRKSRISFWSLTMKSLIVTITVSIVLGLVTYSAGSWLYWGGVHGYEINKFLLANTGIPGAILVSLLLVGLVMAIYLNELRIAYVTYRRKINAHNARVAAEKAAKEEERRRIEESLRKSDELVDNVTPAVNTVAEEPVTERQLVFDEDPFTSMPEPATDNDRQVYHDTVIPSSIEPDTASEIQERDITEHCYEPSYKETVSEKESETATDSEIGLTVKDNAIQEAESVEMKPYDPTAELPRFHFPSVELLKEVKLKTEIVDETEMEENKERIIATLKNYKIAISHIEATVGPTVTLYEIIPAEGVRISQIKNLSDDIALSLRALGVRIIAPIPGKGTVGIEVPNKDPQMVPIRSVITSRQFQETKCILPMAMGAEISKDIYIADLTDTPHLLVAGATGQGKSVGLNTIITSLLYKKHPSELKFVLIDPKSVEFNLYAKLERHYLAKLPDEENPIITDPMKVVATLNSLCVEMDNRFALLNKADERNIKDYNDKFIARKLNPENGHMFMPYIVVIVDEFADLIMVAGKEVERPIARLAQKARAAGIHLILATQRPSTDVITGMIKANFPGRMAFRVMQMVDSRTILDQPGANQLIGRGDMLISIKGEVKRVQCAFISTSEVADICRDINDQMGYTEAYTLPEYVPEGDGGAGGTSGAVSDRDPLFEEAARFIISSSTASTSMLQRRYQIGYNRAGRLMDQFEAAGIVGPASGAKPRSVLMDSLQLDRYLEINNIS